jgi:hypothetical protein
MKRSETFKELPDAFSQFQSEVMNPKLTKDNPYFKSKYSPLDEVLKVVRPVLSKYGLSVTQEVYTPEGTPDHIGVITSINHKSGEWVEFKPLILPAFQKLKDGRHEFNSQGAGSSITYAKRYQLQAALGIAADSDDDGETQSHGTSHNYAPPKTIKTPTEATLKARFQLATGSAEGFEDYIKGLRDKGHDDAYILSAIDRAMEKKKTQKTS